MKNKEFKQRLRASLHQIENLPAKEHLSSTKQLVEVELCKKRKEERIGFAKVLAKQIRFTGWKIWLAQGLMIMAVNGLLTSLLGKYYLENPNNVVRLLCCLSILVLMTALPLIYRSTAYRMHEVEAATRFSSVKLLFAKLLIIGIGDSFLLCSMLAVSMQKTSFRVDSLLLYVWFPYLLAGSGCLFLLGHFAPKQFFFGSTGWCLCLMTIFLIIGRRNITFSQAALTGWWIVIFMILISFNIQQIRYIMCRASYTEMQMA